MYWKWSYKLVYHAHQLHHHAILADLTFVQSRHLPPTQAHDREHPDFCVRAENDEQERDCFLRCDAPVWIGVGYPEEGDVEDDEYAAQDEDWYCEEGEAREDGAFGCLEILVSGHVEGLIDRVMALTLREL